MKKLIGSVLFTAALFFGANGMMAQAKVVEPVQLTKKRAKALEVSAKTAEDHLKLAAYYRQLAHHQREESSKQSDLAAYYARNPIYSSSKFRASTLDHSEYYAQKFQRDAQRSEDLAARHDVLARVKRDEASGN